MAGIRELIVISAPIDLPLFQRLFKDISPWCLKFIYVEQPKADGLAQAFILGKDLIKNDAVYLILTDNIFYRHGLTEVLTRASQLQHGGLVFDYKVTEAQNYGVIEFKADDGKAISIEEKPKIPKSK